MKRSVPTIVLKLSVFSKKAFFTRIFVMWLRTWTRSRVSYYTFCGKRDSPIFICQRKEHILWFGILNFFVLANSFIFYTVFVNISKYLMLLFILSVSVVLVELPRVFLVLSDGYYLYMAFESMWNNFRILGNNLILSHIKRDLVVTFRERENAFKILRDSGMAKHFHVNAFFWMI